MNFLYKHLMAAGFEIEITDGEIKFIHSALGEARFVDWSSEAYKQLREHIEKLRGNCGGGTALKDISSIESRNKIVT